MRIWRWLSSLPLGMKLYFWFWTVLVPAGVALLLAGAIVPGLVLLVCFVFDQAVFTPLIVARSQRQTRSGSVPNLRPPAKPISKSEYDGV
jgi:hypothetical protein